MFGRFIIAQRDVTIKISVADAYSANLQKYSDQMKRAEDSTRELGKSSDSTMNTIKAMFTLQMVQQVGNYVGQMIDLGNEANLVETRFRALAAGLGDYETVMQGMRDATRGTIDDLTLQSGASRLVQLAHVQTADEMNKLLRVIIQTKAPQEDLNTSIEKFARLLSSGSIQLLDNYGIAVGDYREEVKRLMSVNEDWTRQEASKQAILKLATKNAEALGSAADAASTSLTRLGTAATNAFQDLAQRSASGAQGFGLAIEYLLGITPQQQAAAKAKAEAAAEALAGDLNDALINAMTGAGQGINQGFVTQFVKTSLQMAAEDPSLTANLDDFMASVFRRMGATVGDTAPFRQILEETLIIHDTNQQMRDAAKEIADENQRQADALAQSAENSRIVLSFTDQLNDLNERNTREWVKQQQIQEMMAGQRAQFMGQLGESGQAAFSAAFQFNGQMAGDTGVPQYMTQGQADTVRANADAVAEYVDQMIAADKANEDLFTDDQIKNAESYRDRLNDMADSAQNAADAFKNMSLDELLGRTSGGRVGEELDVVIQKMKDLGAETWEVNNAQRSFDLASGRETWMGQAFEDQIATKLAQMTMEGLSPHLVAAITREFDAVMSGAQLRGIDINSPEFQSMTTSTFMNPMFNPDTFNPDEYLAGFAPAAAASDTLAANVGAIGTTSGDLSSNMDLAKASSADISGYMLDSDKHMENMSTNAKTFSDELDKVTSKKHIIEIEPQFVNVPFLAGQLFPQLFQQFAQHIQGGGGQMQGVSPRASLAGPQ